MKLAACLLIASLLCCYCSPASSFALPQTRDRYRSNSRDRPGSDDDKSGLLRFLHRKAPWAFFSIPLLALGARYWPRFARGGAGVGSLSASDHARDISDLTADMRRRALLPAEVERQILASPTYQSFATDGEGGDGREDKAPESLTSNPLMAYCIMRRLGLPLVRFYFIYFWGFPHLFFQRSPIRTSVPNFFF